MAIEQQEEQSTGLSNGILGMLFLLTTEFMFFAGLISAFVVNTAKEPVWPPMGQPRLPIEVTAINTIILLFSGITFFSFYKQFEAADGLKKSKALLIVSIIAGSIFLAVQGTEWVKLLHFGLTAGSGIYGGFFYLIIGAHGLHVVAGICVLLYLLFSLKDNTSAESLNKVKICGMYWYFVVGIWPVLYYLVYLS